MRAMSMPFFGHYRLVRRVAAGGMAEIHLAWDTRAAHWVALKRVLPSLSHQRAYLTMFLDEARHAAQLDHPNVAKVLEWGHVDGAPFMAMEYVEGPTVQALKTDAHGSNSALAVSLCCYIVARAADGLHHAHQARDDDQRPLGIIHRDVSPQNIMVSRHGEVKVIDFGVAKTNDNATITQTGVIKGKIAYMSPEQCKADNLDARTDIFSLGVVLYELVTDTKMHPADENPVAVAKRILANDQVRPSTLNADVPRSLDEIILAALQKDRAKRTPTMREFASALDGWMDDHVGHVGKAHLARWIEDHAAHLCGMPDAAPMLTTPWRHGFMSPGPTLPEMETEASAVLTQQLVECSSTEQLPSLLGGDRITPLQESIALLRDVVADRVESLPVREINPWHDAAHEASAMGLPSCGALVDALGIDVEPVATTLPQKASPGALVKVRVLHWPSTPFHEWRRAHSPPEPALPRPAPRRHARWLPVAALVAGLAYWSAQPAPPAPEPAVTLGVPEVRVGPTVIRREGGALRVLTSPEDADVVVEGTHVGTTSKSGLYVSGLPVRQPLDLIVKRTGYQSVRFSVRLARGEVTTLPVIQLVRQPPAR